MHPRPATAFCFFPSCHLLPEPSSADSVVGHPVAGSVTVEKPHLCCVDGVRAWENQKDGLCAGT
eukprot:363547-Chlamydomonas_euryale.AAC.10